MRRSASRDLQELTHLALQVFVFFKKFLAIELGGIEDLEGFLWQVWGGLKQEVTVLGELG